MNDEFPTEEEEYDLLCQQYYEEEKSQPVQNKTSKEVETNLYSIKSLKNSEPSTSFNNFENNVASSTSQNHNGGSKRSYDELFGDISDLLGVDDFEDRIIERKDKRPRWDEPDKVINVILEARQKLHPVSNGYSVVNRPAERKIENSISERVPLWNFVAVTRRDSKRLYVRLKENVKLTNINLNASNLLPVSYQELKSKAEEILIKRAEKISLENSDNKLQMETSHELWVDKYRPRVYLDLLSDESVNRVLLHWLKLWDQTVFNKPTPQKKQKTHTSTAVTATKSLTNFDINDEVDNKGNIIHKIALLSGPPGLGKTTLAHIAAKHAGYNVVEVNASDERSPDAFRQILLSSTQMKQVLGKDPQPNCLVLDEIDGAPAASIELLLKFAQGKLISKGKADKNKTKKETFQCHRPIICICNELYTPSLRALRTAALIIQFPEINASELADRLTEIAWKEKLNVHRNVLLTLAQTSNCDIRSCLSALQFMGETSSIKLSSLSMKNSQMNLFDSWREVLSIRPNKHIMFNVRERIRHVLQSVQGVDSDRLAQGIFHNYPENCIDKMQNVTTSMKWFQFFDKLISVIHSEQAWTLYSYVNYSFVIWHLNFAKAQNPKLSYPSTMYENSQKLQKNKSTLNIIRRTYQSDIVVLTVDIIPLLPNILSPQLRTVSSQLYTSKEREDLDRLVNIILDFGLSIIQEKKADNSYEFKYDLDILEIAYFPDCGIHKNLSGGLKQIIAHELESERLRRIETAAATRNIDSNHEESNQKNKTDAGEVVNTGQDKSGNTKENINKGPGKMTPKPVNNTTYKNFFGQVITVDPSKISPGTSKNKNKKFHVWYKYKEGFSNAVRRRVSMKKFM